MAYTISFNSVSLNRVGTTTTVSGSFNWSSNDSPVNYYIQGTTNDLKSGSKSGQFGSGSGTISFSFDILNSGSSTSVNLIAKNSI